DLMGPTGHGFSLDQCPVGQPAHDAKMCLRPLASSVYWPHNIFFARANQSRCQRKFLSLHRPVSEQQVIFLYGAPCELFVQRTVGEFRFGKNEDARSLLVQTMNDGQTCPARLAVPQPVVNSLAGMRARRVSVHSS